MKLFSVLLVLSILGCGALAQRSCYSCDSESDSNCATLAETASLNSKDCDDVDETQCAVTVLGLRTIRGCKAEIEALTTAECTDETCGLCTTNLCNNGIYPENRLQCHKCTTCDYITNNRNLGVCENYSERDSCYVVVDQVANAETATIDIVSYRGCSSSAEDEGFSYCLSHPDKCVSCSSSNGCNNDPSYTNSALKCHKCDEATDSSCAYDQTWRASTLCDYNKFFGAEEYCYTYTKDNGQIARGCLMELAAENEIRQKCDGTDEKCKICSGADCNSETTEITYGSCVLCDGTTDPNCASLEESYGVVLCGPSDVGGCFRANIFGSIIRSCVSELLPEEIQACMNGDYGVDCKICQGDLCNAKVDFPVCHECDSRTDPDCNDYQTGAQKACEDYMDSCVAYIDSASGATVRGCKKELSNFSGCTDGDNHCVDCDRSYCNAAAIPWWRIKCHQCEGVGCGKTTWENSKYCSKYEDNDQCYSVIAAVDGDIEVYRGCMSDLQTSPGKQFCEAQGENCSKCSLSECNSQELETYGQCYFCDGITDPNCATLTGVEPIYCPKGDGEKEACFRAQVDGVIVRGCVSQLLAGEVNLCEAGTDCKICEGDNCNGKIDFQSCYTCDATTNPGCVFAQISSNAKTTCSDYLDECVTYTDNGVTYRGCRKELNVPEVCPSCSFCATGDCNANVATVPSELTCHVCDSTTDPDCVADKSAGVTTLCDYSLVVGRPDLCYVFETATEISRGCLYNAPFEVQFSCTSGNAECKVCGTAGCNSEVVETYGQCYYCDGTSDPNCAEMTGVSPIYCPQGEKDGCFRSQVDGYIVRGCVSQLLAGEVNLCEAGTQCKICEGDNCNGKKNFQSCYTCDANNPGCFLAQTASDRKVTCSDYLDECVTYTDNGVTYRGCSKELSLPSTCPSCSFCNGDDCNSAVATVPSELTCHVCDSSTDPSCEADQSNAISTVCDYSLVVGRDDLCYTYQEEGTIRRGCLYNAPFEVQFVCLSGNEECKLCGSAGCNSEEKVTYGKCYFCDGTTDSNCANMDGDILSIDCPKGDRIGCFRSQVDGQVVRGCVSQLAAGEISLCRSGTGTNCKFCEGDNCNGKVDFQSCYTCNSLTDPNCVQVQNSATSVKVTCSEYLDECVSYIDAGVTYRGCALPALPLPTCTATTCAFCQDGDCNGAIFPTNRIACHQCSGSAAECFDAQSVSTSSVCKNYIAGDACYTIVSNDKSAVYRGCMSDAEENTGLCAGSICERCTTSSCNSIPAVSKSTFSCVKCSNEESCAWGYDSAEAEMCTNDVWIGETESCYTLETSSGVSRGCSLDDLDTCSDNSCEACTSSSCNTKTLNYFKCYQCDSKVSGQESCAEEADGLTATECPGDEQKYSELGCYLLKKEDDSVERGCLSQLGASVKNDCREDDSEAACQLCLEEGCNNQSGAASLAAMSTLALLLVAFLVWY